MTTNELLYECLRHFAHLDEANAAIHCAPTRYSPITFRLAEMLAARQPMTADDANAVIDRVVSHIGTYEEDTGR